MTNKKEYSFSRIFCLGVVSIMILNFVLDGMLNKYFLLTPKSIGHGFELWRLLSFPLAGNTIVGTLLFCFTFWLISPKIEEMFQKGIYPLIIALLVFMQGIVSTLVFWKSDIYFAGAEGLSFFVLTVFALFQRRKKIVLWNLKPVRLEFLFVLMIFTWMCLVSLQAIVTHNLNLLITNTSSLLFGVIFSIIVYSHMRLVQKIKIIKQFENKRINLQTPPDELSYALINQAEKRNQENRRQEEPEIHTGDYYSEDRLNEILDKMIETGRESLSFEELRYLEDYSDFLNK